MKPKGSMLAAIQGGVFALYSRLVYRTSRLTIEGWEHVEAALEADRPIIFVNWHGQIHLFYCVYATHFKMDDMLLVIVGDWRQGLLGYFAAYAGAEPYPVDMRDDSMAGARNLLALIRKFTPGKFSYMSPDGPDGPAHVAKDGTTFIAQRTEALILPVANRARHALHVPRWDRYTLPIPFTRIYSVIRPAIQASREIPSEQLLETMTRELNLAEERVDAFANKQT